MLAGPAGRLEGGGLRLRGRRPHALPLACRMHLNLRTQRITNRTANTAGAACSKATCAKHAPVQTARRGGEQNGGGVEVPALPVAGGVERLGQRGGQLGRATGSGRL